jgi:ABC-type bacteriocin/lantibiotic exporter with double-glycine peptidase domain
MMTKSPAPSFVRTYPADHLKPVVQEDRTGCGIACAAMLAGVTYRHAKEVAARLGIQVTDSRLWSDTTFIRILLKHYGIETDPQEQPFCSWAFLPPLALLAIKWQRKGDRAFWHWVIFWRTLDRAVVLDPKRTIKTNIRTDFGRINPQWFINIQSRKRLSSRFIE